MMEEDNDLFGEKDYKKVSRNIYCYFNLDEQLV